MDNSDNSSHSSCNEFDYQENPYKDMNKISMANFSVKDQTKAEELLQK